MFKMNAEKSRYKMFAFLDIYFLGIAVKFQKNYTKYNYKKIIL